VIVGRFYVDVVAAGQPDAIDSFVTGVRCHNADRRLAVPHCGGWRLRRSLKDRGTSLHGTACRLVHTQEVLGHNRPICTS